MLYSPINILYMAKLPKTQEVDDDEVSWVCVVGMDAAHFGGGG